MKAEADAGLESSGWTEESGRPRPSYTSRRPSVAKKKIRADRASFTDTPMAVRSTRALFVGKRWKKGYRGGAPPHLPQ